VPWKVKKARGGKQGSHTRIGHGGFVAAKDVLGLAGVVLGCRDFSGDIALVHGACWGVYCKTREEEDSKRGLMLDVKLRQKWAGAGAVKGGTDDWVWAYLSRTPREKQVNDVPSDVGGCGTGSRRSREITTFSQTD
jgi:hypothetical protein